MFPNCSSNHIVVDGTYKANSKTNNNNKYNSYNDIQRKTFYDNEKENNKLNLSNIYPMPVSPYSDSINDILLNSCENSNDMLNLPDSENSYLDSTVNNTYKTNMNIFSVRDLIGPDCMKPLNMNIYKEEPILRQGKVSARVFGDIFAYAANTHQGIIRNYNEDRVSIVINMNKPIDWDNNIMWPRVSFFGIFDGHAGSLCAEYLRDNLLKKICTDVNFPNNIPNAIKGGFSRAEEEFTQKYALSNGKVVDNSGSCAIILLIVNGEKYMANVGDSRGLMSLSSGNNFRDITIDHRPAFPIENKRIIEAGGRIYRTQTPITLDTYNNNYLNNNNKQFSNDDYNSIGGPYNNTNNSTNINSTINYSKGLKTGVLLGPPRVFPGRLSVSRTIGDACAKIPMYGGNPKVVVSDPDIYKVDDDDIDFIIMGCDGVFDQLKSNEVFQCAWMVFQNPKMANIMNTNYNKCNNKIGAICGNAIDLILKASMARKSFDNVTCLIVAFKDLTGLTPSYLTNKGKKEDNIITNCVTETNDKMIENTKISYDNKTLKTEVSSRPDIEYKHKKPETNRNLLSKSYEIGSKENINNLNMLEKLSTERNNNKALKRQLLNQINSNYHNDNNNDNDNDHTNKINSKRSIVTSNNNRISNENSYQNDSRTKSIKPETNESPSKIQIRLKSGFPNKANNIIKSTDSNNNMLKNYTSNANNIISNNNTKNKNNNMIHNSKYSSNANTHKKITLLNKMKINKKYNEQELKNSISNDNYQLTTESSYNYTNNLNNSHENKRKTKFVNQLKSLTSDMNNEQAPLSSSIDLPKVKSNIRINTETLNHKLNSYLQNGINNNRNNISLSNIQNNNDNNNDQKFRLTLTLGNNHKNPYREYKANKETFTMKSTQNKINDTFTSKGNNNKIYDSNSFNYTMHFNSNNNNKYNSNSHNNNDVINTNNNIINNNNLNGYTRNKTLVNIFSRSFHNTKRDKKSLNRPKDLKMNQINMKNNDAKNSVNMSNNNVFTESKYNNFNNIKRDPNSAIRKSKEHLLLNSISLNKSNHTKGKIRQIFNLKNHH